MNVWNFIQGQLLGMNWLNELIGKILSRCGIDVAGKWGGTLHFFLYDVLKITILLCVLIFIISYIQSYFPPERSKKILGRDHGLWANILGALLGTVTPFCSCSSIPLFIGFTRAGLPLGVTFSFLISSPMVDLGSLVLLTSIFGAKIAAIYTLAGLVIAVVGGTLLEKMQAMKTTSYNKFQKRMTQLTKRGLLVLDDFLLHTITEEAEVKILFELLERRLELHNSTIICSQREPKSWTSMIYNDEVAANALMKRVTKHYTIVIIPHSN